MNRFLLYAITSGAALLTLSGVAAAGEIFSQSQLSGILGSHEVMEDFEGNGRLGEWQYIDSVLNSTSRFSGNGPGLCQPGATYLARALVWNQDGYYGLKSRTFGDSSAWRGLPLTIRYTMPVEAFGFDLQGFQGYDQRAIVRVYDRADALLVAAPVDGGFFGWRNRGGIGRVIVSALGYGYTMIDNHGYGTPAAVPEPGTWVAFGVGALVVLRRRR